MQRTTTDRPRPIWRRLALTGPGALAVAALLTACGPANGGFDVGTQAESDASNVRLVHEISDAMTLLDPADGWLDDAREHVAVPITLHDLTAYDCTTPVHGLTGKTDDYGDGMRLEQVQSVSGAPRTHAAAEALADKLDKHWTKLGYDVKKTTAPNVPSEIDVTMDHHGVGIGAYIDKGVLQIEGSGTCANDND